jgi:heterodisulfide reductase subunit B
METRVFGYYPGCELRTRARGLDLSARKACQALGITLEEMKDWTCCGGLIPQVKDNYMGFLAPARVLLEAHTQGFDELVTLCAFCFNTLRRASYFLQSHPEARRKVATFLEVEDLPETRVIHLLELLRDHVGFDRLQESVRRPLQGVRVAPYYGCLLLRPAEEIGLDDPEDPTIMEELLKALGCDVVEFPTKTSCCGSYHIVTNREVAARCADLILHSAVDSQVELLVTSCPVCQFNLNWRQAQWKNTQLPLVYFPQLLALALGEPVETLGLSEQAVSALSLVPSAR